ncbi:hypothetical protein PRIPAC_80372 [Pristionchus pacificus]|uniref:Uncharacterized protein n=1 Tax=Pristionchus pacificus TaxID=54126 RepID=A0A2A6C2K3_PRIPA|nr:hypothetical protein PRIPAC_80372 [Pristionchus pacificus]|eukprot:PDM72366.1 hypothetical protein PRIPAC_38800 [Pristionchus pacificus]
MLRLKQKRHNRMMERQSELKMWLRKAYIKGESSDWIVKEVLSKKEHLLFFNPKGKGNGALLRNALTKELEDNFNAFAAFRSIFFVIVWRATMKKDMTLIRSYTSGTGGGKDPAMEALVAKHESPSEADSLLMSLLKNTVGAFGVGDIMLETGHVGIHSY